MTLAFVKKFFTEKMLRTQVKRVTMCGDVGDPIYCKEYIEICRYIKTVNPAIHIFTITNGSHKKPEWWRELASVLNSQDTINFSVDGYDNASNNLYRVNSNFDSIIGGIKSVREINSDVFLNWASIVFAFNQDHLDNITNQARALQMDAVQLTYSTKFGSVYGSYGGAADPLEPRPEFISKTHRYERSMIALSSRKQDNHEYLEHNQKKYIEIKEKYAGAAIVPLCEVGNRGIYVNAEGVVFPCSWVSFPYQSLTHGDKTIKWEDSFFAKHRDRMNLHNRSFDEIIKDPLWNSCSRGFLDPATTWVECGQKCSANVVNQQYAVGWETN